MLRSALSVALLTFVTLPTIAHADAIYTYTGAPFTDNSGPYTPEDRLTGTITFAEPLAPNLHPPNLYTTNVIPIAFSFSDGLQTITQNNLNGEINDFSFATDSVGELTAYQVAIGYLANSTCSDTVAFYLNVPNLIPGGGSDGSHCTGSPYDSSLGVSYEAGTFEPVATTPEPSSFALLGTGLLGVVGVMRKRFA